jgi:hypothetical protein
MENCYLVWATKETTTICPFGLPWMSGGCIHSEEEANKKKEMLEEWGYAVEIEVTTYNDIWSRKKTKYVDIERYKK